MCVHVCKWGHTLHIMVFTSHLSPQCLPILSPAIVHVAQLVLVPVYWAGTISVVWSAFTVGVRGPDLSRRQTGSRCSPALAPHPPSWFFHFKLHFSRSLAGTFSISKSIFQTPLPGFRPLQLLLVRDRDRERERERKKRKRQIGRQTGTNEEESKRKS